MKQFSTCPSSAWQAPAATAAVRMLSRATRQAGEESACAGGGNRAHFFLLTQKTKHREWAQILFYFCSEGAVELLQHQHVPSCLWFLLHFYTILEVVYRLWGASLQNSFLTSLPPSFPLWCRKSFCHSPYLPACKFDLISQQSHLDIPHTLTDKAYLGHNVVGTVPEKHHWFNSRMICV